MTRSLLLADSAGLSSEWSGGAAQYFLEHEVNGSVLVVAVRCKLGTLTVDELALLDTGAQWSVVGGELAELVAGDTGETGERVRISTRLGQFTGHLHRLSITLVADEGADLQVSATVLIAPEWPGPLVLGYRGLLERVRFALDPGVANDDSQWMFFGPTAHSG